MYSENDLQLIRKRGSSLSAIELQIQYFINGFPFLTLKKPATVTDGVIRLSDDEVAAQIQYYNSRVENEDISLLKFVPASGAASRMFKSLFAFLEEGKEDKSTTEFFDQLSKFAFYSSLKKSLLSDDIAIEEASKEVIAEYFLTDKGLGYGSLPKGLLEFHEYEVRPRTPLEEHLVEAVSYANAGGTAMLHFTVSPEHRDKFEKLLVERLPTFESQYGVKFYVTFSEQHPSTDTIAVNLDNTPFREKDGSILFRPAGHGALLANLNDLEADVIFIKNVDNVVPDHLKETTIHYKKALGGLILGYQSKIFGYLTRLDSGEESDALIAELDTFFREEMSVVPSDNFTNLPVSEKIAYFKTKLNRPIRICGMVKNEGEPGGGPFWVDNSDGTTSLQVVESAQVDFDNEDQKATWNKATHFNPVDLVVATKDYQGNSFDLMEFRDPMTGFITSKSKDGKELKAQELPGLWNGSMSDWNTLFVEVPLITFNPVKTVNDLLREQHQKA